MGIEWAWLRDDGTRHTHIPEIDLRAPGPRSLLLLHGLTGGPLELAYVAHYLHRRGKMTVTCPALINHGQPIAALARTRWQDLWANARWLFRRAHARATADGAVLFVGGLSVGAVLALMLAAEFQSEIAGVACLSPTFFYDGWNVPWFHRFLALVDYTPFKYFTYLREGPPYGLKDEALRAKIQTEYEATSLSDRRSGQSTYAHFPIRLLCENRRLIKRATQMLPAVTAPVLVVQSAIDESTGPANARHVLDHISSQSKRLLLLHNSYHVVTADLEREQVAAAMAEFFSESCQTGIHVNNEKAFKV